MEVIHAKFNDRIVFAAEEVFKPVEEKNISAWSETEGSWCKHPVFGGKDIERVIEFLRGNDCDV